MSDELKQGYGTRVHPKVNPNTHLKNCPFCNGEAMEDFEPHNSEEQIIYIIACLECGVEMEITGKGFEPVIKAWNTRHTPEAVKGVADLIDALVSNYDDLQDDFADISIHMSTGTAKDVTDAMVKNTQAKRGQIFADLIGANYDRLKAYKIHIGE